MDQRSLFLVASNIPSFSSAIYRIDLKTGKRLPGTFWSSGYILNGEIKDIDNDSKVEFLGIGCDNGYEDAVFFVYEIDTLTKVRPTTEQYLLQNFPVSEMKAYIRFPKTDYDNYRNFRMPVIQRNSYQDVRYYQFIVSGDYSLKSSSLWYQVDYNLKDINIIVGNQFRVMRDSLVARGELQPPLTDTEEYKNILKSKILYWKNGKWVKRDEFD